MKLKVLFLSVALPLLAEITLYDNNEGMRFRFGADMRNRWESYDRAVTNPDISLDRHPANQYYRVRTRVWGIWDIDKDTTITLRLTNRIHHVSSSPKEPNNRDAATWEAPDEVIADLANIELRNLLDGHLSITLGRQALMFGNGMIFSDTTPFDQGRTTYMDGITAVWKDEVNTITGFVMYEEWKDRYAFINDQNRRLRSSDILTAGAYWTHTYSRAFNTDVYYVFSYADDKHPREAERNFGADESANMHTVGIRLFGQPLEWLDYSLEGAREFGDDDEKAKLEGTMIDARVNFQLPVEPLPKTVFGVEYTQFSGDKSGTGHNEGWKPLYAQSPIWGDELIPIMIDGNWTNLHIIQGRLTMYPSDSISVGLFGQQFIADEDDGNLQSNNGDNFGLLWGLDGSYKYNEHLSFRVQLSHFKPGDYFINGQDSLWTRMEMTLTL